MKDVVSLLEKHLSLQPRLGTGVYLARGAVVIGDVTLGDHTSVWHNAVLRGDINRIEVGQYSNIQDNAVVHLSEELPCCVGDYVTIGHAAVVHACSIGDVVLVGMGATVLDGAVVGVQCLIGANALVPQGMEIPEGSLVLGCPARVVRELAADERGQLKEGAERYAENAAYCLKMQKS